MLCMRLYNYYSKLNNTVCKYTKQYKCIQMLHDGYEYGVLAGHEYTWSTPH